MKEMAKYDGDMDIFHRESKKVYVVGGLQIEKAEFIGVVCYAKDNQDEILNLSFEELSSQCACPDGKLIGCFDLDRLTDLESYNVSEETAEPEEGQATTDPVDEDWELEIS